MLTKAFILVLVMLIGLALGFETARYVHTAGGASTGMVNIHRALLGFSLLATSGALLLSLRGAVVGVWLSRLWSRFTAQLELTLDGLFDFDALNVGDGTGPVVLRGDDAKHAVVSLISTTTAVTRISTPKLAPQALALRTPPPPEKLIDALQDRIHQDLSTVRIAKSVRVKRDG